MLVESIYRFGLRCSVHVSGAFTGRKYEQRCEQFADYECAFTFCERAFSFDSAGLLAFECEQNVNVKKDRHIKVFSASTDSPVLAKGFRQSPRRYRPDCPLRCGERCQ